MEVREIIISKSDSDSGSHIETVDFDIESCGLHSYSPETRTPEVMCHVQRHKIYDYHELVSFTRAYMVDALRDELTKKGFIDISGHLDRDLTFRKVTKYWSKNKDVIDLLREKTKYQRTEDDIYQMLRDRAENLVVRQEEELERLREKMKELKSRNWWQRLLNKGVQ